MDGVAEYNAFGNLTITGDGTLDVTGGTADTSHGISVLGKLEIR